MMKCYVCGDTKDLWNIVLYNVTGNTQDVYCCKTSLRCKKKTWNHLENMIFRENKIDFENGKDVWNHLFPGKPLPKKLRYLH